MADSGIKSILERKTHEIRAFREELRKKSLEGEKGVINALVGRGKRLGLAFENLEESGQQSNSDEKIASLKITVLPKDENECNAGRDKKEEGARRAAGKKIMRNRKKMKKKVKSFEEEESEIKRRLRELEEKGLV